MPPLDPDDGARCRELRRLLAHERVKNLQLRDQLQATEAVVREATIIHDNVAMLDAHWPGLGLALQGLAEARKTMEGEIDDA